MKLDKSNSIGVFLPVGRIGRENLKEVNLKNKYRRNKLDLENNKYKFVAVERGLSLINIMYKIKNLGAEPFFRLEDFLIFDEIPEYYNPTVCRFNSDTNTISLVDAITGEVTKTLDTDTLSILCFKDAISEDWILFREVN